MVTSQRESVCGQQLSLLAREGEGVVAVGILIRLWAISCVIRFNKL